MFCDDFCEHRLSLTNRDYDFVSLLRHYHEKELPLSSSIEYTEPVNF